MWLLGACPGISPDTMRSRVRTRCGRLCFMPRSGSSLSRDLPGHHPPPALDITPQPHPGYGRTRSPSQPSTKAKQSAREDPEADLRHRRAHQPPRALLHRPRRTPVQQTPRDPRRRLDNPDLLRHHRSRHPPTARPMGRRHQDGRRRRRTHPQPRALESRRRRMAPLPAAPQRTPADALNSIRAARLFSRRNGPRTRTNPPSSLPTPPPTPTRPCPCSARSPRSVIRQTRRLPIRHRLAQPHRAPAEQHQRRQEHHQSNPAQPGHRHGSNR